jgi:predicted deacylase
VSTVELPISRLSTHTEITLPVRVLHGANSGPVLFISAGVHGDEIIGVEVIRRLMGKVDVGLLAGTLVCIPVVNVFGFIQHQRCLPDRRDLNRCFPGSSNGSLAAQLANVFNEQIVKRSNFGIDLHSAALHRTNLPQIRISNDRPVARELALAFGAPAIITAPLRPGSLRAAALASNVDVLLYEAGTALRFDELSIRVGLRGILRVMAHLEMSVPSKGLFAGTEPIESRRTIWVRAPEGGIFRMQKQAGARVRTNDVLGVLSDPFGDTALPVRAPIDGVIIGRTNLPVVNQGDALMHIAEVFVFNTAARRVKSITKAALADPLLEEDEVI